jgi:DNA invertase Pin-like site-specific DNA recombinase
VSQPKRVALYTRVSKESMTAENQRADLLRWAQYRGHAVVAEYCDAGISGAKGRDQRPGLDALVTAATRREFDLVACWSLCRVGRSMVHLVQLGETFRELGIALYAHKDGIDTSTTAGELVYHVMGALAQFERSRLRERTIAGLQRARRQGKRLGRPPIPGSIRARAERMLAAGVSQSRVRRELHLGGDTINSIVRAMRQEGLLGPASAA